MPANKMLLRGTGIKATLRKTVIRTIKWLFPPGILYNAPRKAISSKEWLAKRRVEENTFIISVYPEKKRIETPPDIFNYRVSKRFTRYYNRTIPGAFVLHLENGMVYGRETNFIITSSLLLLSDVSREFGQYGGRPMERSTLINYKLRLPTATTIKGRVAVITTTGSNNFHHWHYDAMPRVHLLKKAGLFDTIDYFIISARGLPFQKESLRLLGLAEDKIISPAAEQVSLFRAEKLYVPSLPSPLGTVSEWVVDFLRQMYNPAEEKKQTFKRIYLSRKNVKTRKIKNDEAFSRLLKEFSIVEIFPEDYTVAGLAKILAGTEFIISVHGSGLSNLCFISPGTTVVDILAPWHQDGYYWMLCNITGSKYIGFFGIGNHPPDDLDLVRKKINEDIILDLEQLRSLLLREISVV